jgi:hypothetical protein
MTTKYISTKVDLDQWGDLELLEEVEARGYKLEDEVIMTEVQCLWQRGDKKGALILLERQYKWLHGLSDLIN